MKFKAVDRDDAIEAQEAYEEITTARESADHEFQQARDACVNWDGVDDDDGNPKAFSPEALHKAWQKAWFRIGVHTAMAESLSGDEARTGN